jgi:hypothetical protein
VKVFVLFEGCAGSPPDVMAVFETKERLCQVMRSEFPKAKARNRKFPSELYWEEDDGFWFRAEKIAFFRRAAK